MKNALHSPYRKHVVAVSAVVATLLPLAAAAQQQDVGRVISATPVIQQVGVPRQVCNNQPMVVGSPSTGAGALVGAIAGGLLGNTIGHGGGRAAATMIGAIGGAAVGDRVEGGGYAQVQNVQNCITQTFYENRTVAYNVVYEYGGRQYSAQMPNDPGPTIQLQISPLAQGNGAPAAAAPSSGEQGAVATILDPSVGQPVYPQAVVGAPTVAYPAYYPSYPAYAQPYFYPPIGLSLNLGFGHHHHRHRRWR